MNPKPSRTALVFTSITLICFILSDRITNLLLPETYLAGGSIGNTVLIACLTGLIVFALILRDGRRTGRENRMALQLTTTLESITDAFMTLDRDWRFTYVNTMAEILVQRPRGDLLGRNMWTEFPDMANSIFEKEYRGASISGTTAAFEAYYPPLNSWFAIRAYPSEIGLAIYFRDITLQRLEREKLSDNEERLRLIIKATNDAIWEYEPATDKILWSQGFEALSGYKLNESEMTGKFWEDHVHPEDRKRVVSGIDAALAGSDSDWFAEYRFLRQGGDYADVQEKGHILRDSTGKAVRMIGGIRDLTERSTAEKALHESELHLTRVLDNLPGMSYRCGLDEKWTMAFASEGSMDLTGYHADELIRNALISYGELIVPEDRKRIWDVVLTAVNQGQSFELEYGIRTRDGEEKRVWASGRYYPQKDGTSGYLEGFILDVSARKNAEAERERLTAAIDQLTEIVLITDSKGFIQYVNPAFERITGYTRFEVIGQNPRFLKSDLHESGFYAEMWRTLTKGQTWTGRIVNRKKDGTHYTDKSIISPVRDSSGQIVNFIAIQTDITGQLVLEEQYRQAQKLEAVARLAGGIAHDFNNMLTVILVRSELAIRRLEPEDPLRTPLNEIHDAAERTAALTKQLLTYARKQAVTRRVVDLNTAIEPKISMLRQLTGETIRLDWLPAENLWEIEIDPVQLDQMLINMCLNARDAIQGRGVISIETNNIHATEEYCREFPECVPGFYVMLVLNDTGSGMDKTTLSHLFEPFYTTKEVGQGSGLGLATVYGIIKQNHGYVHVKSEPGSGTEFRIYLPRHGEPPTAEESLQPVHSAYKGETVLLVEDEPLILEVTAEILSDLGFDVLKAGSPDEAMDIAGNHPGKIHLILTDLVLPSMNGQDLTEILRKTRPELNCLYMSGYTAVVAANLGLVAQESQFIQKPFTMFDLEIKIRHILGVTGQDMTQQGQ